MLNSKTSLSLERHRHSSSQPPPHLHSPHPPTRIQRGHMRLGTISLNSSAWISPFSFLRQWRQGPLSSRQYQERPSPFLSYTTNLLRKSPPSLQVSLRRAFRGPNLPSDILVANIRMNRSASTMGGMSSKRRARERRPRRGRDRSESSPRRSRSDTMRVKARRT